MALSVSRRCRQPDGLRADSGSDGELDHAVSAKSAFQELDGAVRPMSHRSASTSIISAGSPTMATREPRPCQDPSAWRTSRISWRLSNTMAGVDTFPDRALRVQHTAAVTGAARAGILYGA